MTQRVLHFYFDYLSPYAFFSWRELSSLCKTYDLQLEAHPVVFGKLLDHWGQLGPAEIPPKKAALYRFCYRYAQLNQFIFNPPANHPFNPLPALRLSLPQLARDRQHDVIDAIFNAGWTQGADLSSEGQLKTILDNIDLNGAELLARTQQTDVKQMLHNETRQAIESGVFGVPTFIIDGELFWGHDQLPHLEIFLRGNDPLNTDAVDEMLARHRGIDRKKMQPG